VRPLLYGAAVLGVGLLVTVVVARGLVDADEREAEERFEESAEQFTVGIEREVEGYFDELVDIGSFHAAARDASPEQFERFVLGTGIFERLPALNGVVYLEVVPQGELDAYVARRRQIDPAFALLRLGETPPGRPHLLLTHYIPGATDLQLPRGADISAITSIGDVVSAANQNGSGVTGSFQDDPLLLQIAQATDFPQIEMLLGMDFFIGMPVYAEPGTTAVPIGWLSAPVAEFDRVLAAATEDLPADLGASLRVDLTGVPDREQEMINRVAEREGEAGPLSAAEHRATQDFDVDGVPWSLTVWSDEQPERGPVTVVVAGGLVASLLAALLVYARIRTGDRERAYAAVLADREEFRRVVLASVADPMVVLDDGGIVIDTNPAWSTLRGRESDEPVDVGAHYLEAIAAQARGDVGVLRDGLARLGTDEGGGQVALDLAIDSRAGRRWFAVRMTRLRSARGGAVVVHSDITERKRSEAELELKATHDDLTGLLNRPAIEEELELAWQRARLTETPVGVLFIDLDGFKPINDTHGHAVGDAVLRAVAQRISGAVRAADRVARLGGDEFVVLLGGLEDRGGAERTARRILDSLAPPIALGDLRLVIRASLGVAVVDGPLGSSARNLIELADQAMYSTKRAGGDGFTVAP
jgi:diguanylate cyclase (GGDEF)-like protein/PAS domain S-box-containing protein